MVSCLAGVGGATSPAPWPTSTFYPDRLNGWALGLNAGGGNLRVPVVQLVGLLVLATAGAGSPRLILRIHVR